MFRRILVALIALCCTLVSLSAWQPPQQTRPETFKQLPPPGIKINDADRDELTKSVAQFDQEIKDVRRELQGQPRLLDLFPDVLIFHKAVDWALKYDEFYEAREVRAARELLKAGRERLTQIKSRKPDYLHETGLVVRGYQSKIDGSIQPYGLVVPESYTPKTLANYRLDVWCHGRGEKLTELAFLDQRSRQPGEFTPRDAFVLHPYGRYCNAYKFAGEVDVLEALDHCRKHYRIDEKRLVMRGFSMGGAACWQFAVHYPDKWCAAAPGAGFAETREFSNIDKDPVPPTWWEKKLWHWYDCTDYAENLKGLPTIAYSGENDRQKQAADVMAREMDKFGLKLRHIIGPKTGHSYHPDAKREIEKRIEPLAARYRTLDENYFFERYRFVTWSLRYAQHHFLKIQSLDEHWKIARISFCHSSADDQETHTKDVTLGWALKTENVSAFTFDSIGGTFTPQSNGLGIDTPSKPLMLIIDKQEVKLPLAQSDRGFTAHFRKEAGKWKVVDTFDDGSLRKKPGLQGPIDDAFMDSFLIVKPSDKSPHAKVNDWVDAEMNRAIDQWRRHFRGNPRVKLDKEITEADINNNHLILWGLPASNSVIKKIADKLPIRWADGKLHTEKDAYDADTHAPIMIYPNPLNPSKYIVLNSGHTFREESNRSNARQVPKLPDWAIVDVTTPPNGYWPGKIASAGFFGEKWEWKEHNTSPQR